MELHARLEERQQSFDLRWKASMRAIKRWQAATGKELQWPDHADLCVWLLERIEEREGLVRELTDPDQCRYDHHGYCQSHALHEKPCPHERSKELLK